MFLSLLLVRDIEGSKIGRRDISGGRMFGLRYSDVRAKGVPVNSGQSIHLEQRNVMLAKY